MFLTATLIFNIFKIFIIEMEVLLLIHRQFGH